MADSTVPSHPTADPDHQARPTPHEDASTRHGKNPSQTDIAYERLRRAIVGWDVSPGAWLTETDLRQLSLLGRTPTREAAVRLIDDALLSVVPRRGYRVSDVTPTDTAALLDTWHELSAMIGRLAAGKAAPETLSRLGTLLNPQRQFTVPAVLDVTEDIFTTILRATGNVWLERMGRQMFNHLQRLWVLELSQGGSSQDRGDLPELLHILSEATPEAGAEIHSRMVARSRLRGLEAVHLYTSRARSGEAPTRTWTT